jgi:hypothetical protein
MVNSHKNSDVDEVGQILGLTMEASCFEFADFFTFPILTDQRKEAEAFSWEGAVEFLYAPQAVWNGWGE